MYNYFYNILEPTKEKIVYLAKNRSLIEGLFTLEHNLGFLSDIPVDTLQESYDLCMNTSYTTRVYTIHLNGQVYTSFTRNHNPLLGSRISRKETKDRVIYTFIVIDEMGRIIGKHLIKSIIKNGNGN